MKRTTCLGMTVVVLSLLGGCSAKARQAAEAATRDFRAQYARGAFAGVYKGAAPDLHSAVTEGDFVKLLEGVNRKLGAWQSSKSPGWRVFTGTGGQTVTLRYESEFEKGAATEEFLWRIQGGGASLVGYHVNSPAFLTN